MFECRLNQFLVEILQQYNASLGLNNPPPTAQLLNAMASFIKQNTVKNIELSFDGNNNELTAKATYNDNRFAETKVDLSYLKYELDVYDLAEKLEGSESIVVDIDETNSKVEIHLDDELVSKIDRALLMPLTRPTEFELVGINDDGEQVRVKLGEGVEYDDLTQTIVASGGGGSKYYMHTIQLHDVDGKVYYIKTISTNSARLDANTAKEYFAKSFALIDSYIDEFTSYAGRITYLRYDVDSGYIMQGYNAQGGELYLNTELNGIAFYNDYVTEL